MMEGEKKDLQSNPMSLRDCLKLLGAASLGLVQWPRLNWAVPAGQAENQPNILVVVFDALSARHMSLYGYERQTTPNLARLANQALVYHRHYAAGNFTSPATASLLTGCYPWKHRAFNMPGGVSQEYAGRSLFGLFQALQYTSFSYNPNTFVNILLNQFAPAIHDLTPLSSLCVASDT